MLWEILKHPIDAFASRMRQIKKGLEPEIDRVTFLRHVDDFLDGELNPTQAGHKGSPSVSNETTKALQGSLLAGYVRDALLTDNTITGIPCVDFPLRI